MPLDLLSTVFSGLTFFVIAATAIAAIVQLRHLRASNQMNALLALMQLWGSPEMQRNFQYLFNDFQEKVKDPKVVALYAQHVALSRSDHPELLVADFWEQIGAYAKWRLLDEDSWLDIAGAQVTRSWEILTPVIESSRKRGGPSVYENFEYLAVKVELWQRRFPNGNWQRGLPHMADLTKDA